jgi:hypothetical protein
MFAPSDGQLLFCAQGSGLWGDVAVWMKIVLDPYRA